jgi:hypothetical protein
MMGPTALIKKPLTGLLGKAKKVMGKMSRKRGAANPGGLPQKKGKGFLGGVFGKNPLVHKDYQHAGYMNVPMGAGLIAAGGAVGQKMTGPNTAAASKRSAQQAFMPKRPLPTGFLTPSLRLAEIMDDSIELGRDLHLDHFLKKMAEKRKKWSFNKLKASNTKPQSRSRRRLPKPAAAQETLSRLFNDSIEFSEFSHATEKKLFGGKFDPKNPNHVRKLLKHQKIKFYEKRKFR